MTKKKKNEKKTRERILKALEGKPIKEGYVAKELPPDVKMPEGPRWHIERVGEADWIARQYSPKILPRGKSAPKTT